jgi:hypothetical protein
VTETQTPQTPATEPAAKREVTTAAVVSLLGIPTSAEFAAFEEKFADLSAKVTNLQLNFNRLMTQIKTILDESYLERIDFQLADIRVLMKAAFPEVVASVESAKAITKPKETKAAGAETAETGAKVEKSQDK